MAFMVESSDEAIAGLGQNQESQTMVAHLEGLRLPG